MMVNEKATATQTAIKKNTQDQEMYHICLEETLKHTLKSQIWTEIAICFSWIEKLNKVVNAS